MNRQNRLNLVAPCGIDCGICELYLSRDNAQLKAALVGVGIPEAVLPCNGCRDNQGHCPIMSGQCATWSCVESHQVHTCGDCPEFPCEMLNPAADGADKLPHNLKVFNLATIKKSGIKGFLEKSAEIKKRYFQGKMVIGKGPVLPEDQ